jgi:hypothetical protein
MKLRKFFSPMSGKVYYVTYSPETYWKTFIETKTGFVSVEAKAAARDCGAYSDNPDANTHTLWSQIWDGEEP